MRGFFSPRDDATSIVEREEGKEDVDDAGNDADAHEPVDDNNVIVIAATASAVGGVLATLLVVLVSVVILKRRRRRRRLEEGNDQEKVEDNEVYGIYYSTAGGRIDQSIMEVRDTNDYYGCDD